MALACTHLLQQELLCAATCFTILATARAAAAPQLAWAAVRVCAQHFDQAVVCDAQGFMELSLEQLLEILQSPSLKVCALGHLNAEGRGTTLAWHSVAQGQLRGALASAGILQAVPVSQSCQLGCRGPCKPQEAFCPCPW